MSGLYVHVPFCRARCRYCAFASSVYDPARAGRYLAALEREAAQAAGPEPRPFDTVYLGGGTPTVLPAESLRRLVRIPLVAEALRGAKERSVEANPGTLDAEGLATLGAAGFERLSLGAQSFDDAELELLGRVHRAEDIRRAAELSRAGGFGNLSLDLIFGLPGQSPVKFFASLESALGLAPEHLSLYGLTYEPGTELAGELAAGRLAPCAEEAEREMYLGAIERLAAAGYEHYEVANFALPGRRCRHNLNYWQGGEYLGLGAGAFSGLAGERRGNVADVEEYCRRLEVGADPVGSRERLEPEKRAREALMLGLRMREGVDLAAFRARTGFDARALFGGTLDGHLAAGRLEIAAGRLRLSLEGLLVANSVMADFI